METTTCSTQSELPDLLPARMVNEYSYCPRLFFLEWVEAEFADNTDTVEGRSRHRRVDQEAGQPPAAAKQDQEKDQKSAEAGAVPGQEREVPVENPGVERVTSLMLSDPEHALIARIDLVEFKDGEAVPIDYKRGSVPSIPECAYEPERVQLCVQGLVLRAAGYRCTRGQVYFAESNTRVTVEFTDQLVERTLEIAREARRTAEEGRIPPPLMDSPKCPRCSLVGICLPDETRFLSAGRSEVSPDDVRRLYPARGDANPLYVQEQGAYLSKCGDQVEVRKGHFAMEKARLLDVSQVNIYGRVQISTQLVQELCHREIPISYFSFGGWFNGITTGMGHKNVQQRRQQYAAAADPAMCLRLAARMMRGKILNCRTLLRRNCRDIPREELRELTRLAFSASRAKELGSLLGIEGAAARLYFSRFGEMLKPPDPGDTIPFDFSGRNRRPPRDPVNCMLSFLYAVLTKESHLALLAVGFDPLLGFYHQPRYGRPALALDLMEEFRPLIVDSVVLQLVNTGEIRGSDFITRAGACTLTPAGKKKILAGFERRMQATVIHPLFGYAASYRRILEIQARLLGRCLGGEIPEYPPFRTR